MQRLLALCAMNCHGENVNRLYFIGSRQNMKTFAAKMSVDPASVIHVRSFLHVKRVVPGSTVYVCNDSITSAKVYAFCKDRGNLDLVIWNPVDG